MYRAAEILEKLVEKIDKIVAALFPQPVPVKVDRKPRSGRKVRRR